METVAFCEREPGVIARQIAGETILVPTRRRASEMALFTLNEVGTFIWELLDGEIDLAGIADEVAETFEVEPATARTDVDEFVTALSQAGCVRERGQS